MRAPLFLLAGALMLGACIPKGAARRMAREMAVGEPGDEWKRVPAGGAEYAWLRTGGSATIYADANCASRYEDGDLGSLLDHLTYGIRHGGADHQEKRVMDGREALLRTWNGALDGVAVRVGAVVLKKDDCVYDLVYIAPPPTFEAGWADFERVLSGFSSQGGRR